MSRSNANGTQRKVVVMAAIPNGFTRLPKPRADLSYVKFARATWEWWCRRNGVDFVLIEAPLENTEFARMPATMQRWAVVDRLLAERGSDAQVALVDADTMIRWDTPDLFARARGFSAVVDPTAHWIFDSTNAFQHLFPETSLSWWEYFNRGIVVMGAAQRRVIRAFLDYSVTNWQELDAVMKSGSFGTDQTPLNFIVRRENEPVHLLPRPFNLVHCFLFDRDLHAIELGESPDAVLFAEQTSARPWALNFVQYGFVWHFTNVVTLRSTAMRETWRRVRDNYPGASIGDE